jgi:hypothetical protein
MPTLTQSLTGAITPTGDVTDFGVGADDGSCDGALDFAGHLQLDVGVPDAGDTVWKYGFGGELGLTGELTNETPQGVVSSATNECLHNPDYICYNEDFATPSYSCKDEQSLCGDESQQLVGFDGTLGMSGEVVFGFSSTLSGSLGMTGSVVNVDNNPSCAEHLINWDDYLAGWTDFTADGWSVVFSGTTGYESFHTSPEPAYFEISAGHFGGLGSGAEWRYYVKNFCTNAGGLYQVSARIYSLGLGLDIYNGMWITSGTVETGTMPHTSVNPNDDQTYSLTFHASGDTVQLAIGIHDIEFGMSTFLRVYDVTFEQIG